MTSNIDREQERPTATGATGSVEPTRDRRAPKIAVGDTSAVQDRKADSTSMKQVRTTFIFLAFLGIAYAAYLVLSGQLDDFVRALIGVNPKWIIAGVAAFCATTSSVSSHTPPSSWSTMILPWAFETS